MVFHIVYFVCFASLIFALLFVSIKLIHERKQNFELKNDLAQMHKEVFKIRENFQKEKENLIGNISGERKPCELCDGCNNLIKTTDGSYIYPVVLYNCKKNIRCKEFEEGDK